MNTFHFDAEQSKSFVWNPNIKALVGFHFFIREIHPAYNIGDNHTKFIITSPLTSKEVLFFFDHFDADIGSLYVSEEIAGQTLKLWVCGPEKVDESETDE